MVMNLDLSKWQPLDVTIPNRQWHAKALVNCDPYLVWADACAGEEAGAKELIGVLIEMNNADDYLELIIELGAPLTTAGKYSGRMFVPNGIEGIATSRFLTGSVNNKSLNVLIDKVNEKKIARFTLQTTRRGVQPGVEAVDTNRALNSYFLEGARNKGPLGTLFLQLRKSSESELTRNLLDKLRDQIKDWSYVEPTGRTALRAIDRKAVEAVNTNPFIGVIDDGLPFVGRGPDTHLWDQGWWPKHLLEAPTTESVSESSGQGMQATKSATVAPVSTWEPPIDRPTIVNAPQSRSTPDLAGLQQAIDGLPVRGFFYGREISGQPDPNAPQMARDSARSGRAATETPDPTDERAAYRDGGYFDPPPNAVHGASVLGLVAPNLSKVLRAGTFSDLFSGLALVQLPTVTVEDTSGGALAMHALDGIRYVLWKESTTRGPKGRERPVVINMSYGINGGAHDGSSMFECALAEILNQNPHVHVTLPAGNAHRAQCHSTDWLSPNGGRRELHWRILPDNPRDVFMEIWLPDDADLTVEVCPPGFKNGACVDRAQARSYDTEFGVIYAQSVAQSTTGTMVLIAVGGTRPRTAAGNGIPATKEPVGGKRTFSAYAKNLNGAVRREGTAAPHGIWTIRLTNRGKQSTSFHAVIERGDAAPDSSRGSRQSYFPDSCIAGPLPQNSTPESTLNGLASFVHDQLHIVGAMRDLDGVLSDYSSAGPAGGDAARVEGPDVVVRGDRSRNLPGLFTRGFASGLSAYLSGTSAASAVYAAELAASLRRGMHHRPIGAAPPEAAPEVICGAELPPAAPDFMRGQCRRLQLAPEPFFRRGAAQ
jgi:hypothetical protein